MDISIFFEDASSASFAEGIIVPTLTPFNEQGLVMSRSINDQARRLSLINGILGIAVNKTLRERQSLSLSERLEVLHQTREGLEPDQLVLSCVGELSAKVEDEIAAYRQAGADAVITFPPHRRAFPGSTHFDQYVEDLAEIADRLPLPIIVTAGEDRTDLGGSFQDISSLANKNQKMIGIDMGTRIDVSRHDQAYYTFEAPIRSSAYLPSSDEALIQNLGTKGDVALSWIAYVAPHEFAALYRSIKTGHFFEARAQYKRLSPLIRLILGHDISTREMILRQIAHIRGLLASTDARGVIEPLTDSLVQDIERTLNDVALAPIKWV